ncbi:MAG TPA: helicase-related protein [Candidatus Dormibacteraeota bacterium]|nr:helicase-related protein [Candidatus Dormibacteraeota bacterium]
MSLLASTTAPSVRIVDDRAEVRFGRFDLGAFDLFLRVKALPEKRLAYDWRTDAYTVTTPARFARLLDPVLAAVDRPAVPLADHLFDYQAFIVERALEARRYAVWADTGLGKTAMFLEWARQVRERTGGRVLILSPLGVIEQTRAEAERFYGPELVPARLQTREALAEWCRASGPGLAITNPEKLIPGVLDDLRRCAGLVLDESSILKSGGGVIKWNLIKSARGVEYKLSCTATPAPNDTMEYASQAAFLEKLRTEGEILWTYFTRDKSGDWRVKPHAKHAFYAFMATWSIYLRDPAHYGWRDVLAGLPPPELIEERVPMTADQQVLLRELQVDMGTGFLGTERMGVRERAKLSQLAKGFLYQGKGRQRGVRRVPSRKPDRVAEIAREEARAGRQVLVWTTYDEESDILAERLAPHAAAVLSGATPPAERDRLLDRFRAGAVRILISKPQLLGYGMNFQFVRAMVFSGFDDSFERMYQAIRRAYRLGQTEAVRVFVPYVPELEGMVLDNVREKERRFLAEVAMQEQCYIEALGAREIAA